MISTSQLSMRFGAKILFTNVSIQFNPGHHYGLIGANGCGKSTFLKILEGQAIADGGNFSYSKQLSLGFLKQDHFMYENTQILDIVQQGNKRLWEALEKKEAVLNIEPFTEVECDLLTNYEKVIEEEGGYFADSEASKLLEGLGIREEWHRKPLHTLSGGYKLRVLLAQVLFGKPDILLLDEPTNHLDLYSIKWLEGYLRNFPGTLLVTSHDRDFLNGVCTHIADFDYKTIKIYKGNYDAFVELKREERELKESTLVKQEKKQEDLQGFIDRFGAKASKARQAQSKARLVEKIEQEIDALDLSPSTRLYPKVRFTPNRPPGVTVLKIQGICKSFGPKKVLENVSFEVERGERIAILGPNGIGKSTLLEILTAQQQADHGNYNWGFAVNLAYFPQDYSREFREKLSLLDWLGQFDTTMSQEKLREILGRVLFSGDTVKQSVHTLSGGEKGRMMLAKLMLLKPNVLIFDEPTNHLDMEAIDELTQALQQFDGTLLLVSHNRYFVSHIATRILEITFDGVKDYKCTYQEYIEQAENDYLSKKKSDSKKDESLVKTTPKKDISFHDQKKDKQLKSQMKRELIKAEELCQRLEKELADIEKKLAADGFYVETSRDEQQRVLKQKEELETKLSVAFNAWEKTAATLNLEEGD